MASWGRTSGRAGDCVDPSWKNPHRRTRPRAWAWRSPILAACVFEEIRNQPTRRGGDPAHRRYRPADAARSRVRPSTQASATIRSKEGFLEATAELVLQHSTWGDVPRLKGLKTLSARRTRMTVHGVIQLAPTGSSENQRTVRNQAWRRTQDGGCGFLAHRLRLFHQFVAGLLLAKAFGRAQGAAVGGQHLQQLTAVRVGQRLLVLRMGKGQRPGLRVSISLWMSMVFNPLSAGPAHDAVQRFFFGKNTGSCRARSQSASPCAFWQWASI